MRARRREAAAPLSGSPVPASVIDAVIFDLDGVLIDSEQVWDTAREQLVRERGGPLARPRAAGHDGHELERVVAVHA